MQRLVVVGGGISGTAAASTARKRASELGLDLEVVLLEREAKIGGKAQSVVDGPWLFETGPLGFFGGEPELDALVRDAGLTEDLVRAGDAASRRFVALDGELREVSSHPLRFATAGLLSLGGLLRAAREPFVPGKRDDADESVWDFAARRLGREFAERLVHPMVLGVFAGDARRISLPAAFPMMVELERRHGSLVRAQLARARARRRGELPPRPVLSSFRKGLQSLPLALAARGRFRVETGAGVEAVLPDGTKAWRLRLEGQGEALPADAVILACEGWRAAGLLETSVPEVAKRLLQIAYPPVCVVALGYGSEALRAIPEGFGALIPRAEGYRALGVTWDSHLFPGRSREGEVLVRVLFGGAFDPSISELDPSEILSLAKDEIARLLPLPRAPLYARARLWPRAIPQYEMGHGDLQSAVETELERRPGLYLAGNALHGASFSNAALRGVECGARAVESLASKWDKTIANRGVSAC